MTATIKRPKRAATVRLYATDARLRPVFAQMRRLSWTKGVPAHMIAREMGVTVCQAQRAVAGVQRRRREHAMSAIERAKASIERCRVILADIRRMVAAQ